MNNFKATQVLRWLGAIFMIAASAVFMVQNWQDYSSLQRFYTFFGFLLGLSGLGFLFGYSLKEPKGARTCFGLAAAGVTGLTSQMAAVVHDVFQLGVPANTLVSFLLSGKISLTLAFTLMVAVSYWLYRMVYSIFLKNERNTALLATATSQILVLLPWRSPEWNLLAIWLALIPTLWLVFQVQKNSLLSANREALLGLLISLSPMVLLMGRSFFYELADLTPTSLAAIGSLFLWALSKSRTFSARMAREFYRVSSFFACFSALFLAIILIDFSSWPDLTDFFLMITAPFLTLAAFEVLGEEKRRYSLLCFAVFMYVVTFSLLFTSSHPIGIFLTVAGPLVGLLMVAMAFRLRERSIYYSGLWMIGYGLVVQIVRGFEFIPEYPWISLGAIGAIILLGATVLEKHGAQLLNFRRKLKKRLQKEELVCH